MIGSLEDSQINGEEASIYEVINAKCASVIRFIAQKINKYELSPGYLRTRSMRRDLFAGSWKFVTLDEVYLWTCDWLRNFPMDYDAIVGLPRSGLIVANIMSVKSGKPLSIPELIIERKIWKSSKIQTPEKFERILLVEDSITTGKEMKQAYDLIQKHLPDSKITKASLMVALDGKNYCDFYYRCMDTPNVFEWDMMHRKFGKVAFDYDGVLCKDCPEQIDADEVKYRKWLVDVEPLFIPTYEIDCIMINRLEKYRPETEGWLKAHDVRYKKLVMWDLPDKKDRNGGFAEHKARMVINEEPDYMIESEEQQARFVHDKTGIPVICIDKMMIFS
jgi:orotate phosphoribosyltransferase